MITSALRRTVRFGFASTTIATAILAVAIPLASSSTALASNELKVFDSTNTGFTTLKANTASGGLWWAYKFTAFESTTVNRIDVFVDSAEGFEGFFVSIGTGFGSGSLGEFNPTEAESGLRCRVLDCARVAFNGSVDLAGGNDYWLWIGARGGSSVTTGLFDGAPATTGGLNLGYTFADGDIRSSTGGSKNSNTEGYPWVRMFATSSDSAGEASSGSAIKSVRISLTEPEGSVCDADSVSGLAGTWVQLPATSDCLPPDGSAESEFLGWATDSDFPVAIAQRQVDNGWGAYETKDEAGQLTGVFIPAGGSTFLTNDTNLYPIWSN